MKQKYTLTIGDIEMNVISEESPEAVEKVVGHVDRKIREINLKSSRCTKHEAALLCALDYCTEKLALQAKLNEVEVQNDKLFRALERVQRENEKLGEQLDLEKARAQQLTASLEAAQAQAAQARLQAQAAAAAAVAATASNPAPAAPAAASAPVISTETVPVAVVAPIAKAESEAPVAKDQPFEQLTIEESAPAEAESAPEEAAAPAEAPAPEEKPAPAEPEAPAKPPVGTATPVDHILQKKKTYSYRSSAAARAKNKVGNMFETLTFHDDE